MKLYGFFYLEADDEVACGAKDFKETHFIKVSDMVISTDKQTITCSCPVHDSRVLLRGVLSRK